MTTQASNSHEANIKKRVVLCFSHQHHEYSAVVVTAKMETLILAATLFLLALIILRAIELYFCKLVSV